MAHQSLYRRYRPRNFAQIKGQPQVVTALRHAIADDSATHAYMFSGPRGTGKTSTARILAKALNCTDLRDGEPCCECDSCVAMQDGTSFDLFELDAASNRGVDAVRELVERTMVASPGRTKVYILDEVHMLTKEASNALLKTLEEPPGHVRFVLATTDPQKVLPTIRSRTQHFSFHLLAAAELTEHARWVAADAGLEVDDAAIAYAVKRGKGSVRDTLSALDQVVATGGVIDRAEPVEELFAALSDGGTAAALVAVADAVAQGHDPRVLAEAFVAEVREAFLLSIGASVPDLVEDDIERLNRWATELGSPVLSATMERVGMALVDMRSAADPRVPLEVALIQLTTVRGGRTGDDGKSTGHGDDTGHGEDNTLAQLATRVEALEAALAQRPATSAPRSTPPDRPRPNRSKPPPPPPRRRAQRSGGSTADTQPAGPTDTTSPGDREAVETTTGQPRDTEVQQSGGTGESLPDRDALVMAFGDAVAPQLKGIAKAMYTQGRFASVTDTHAVFAVENEPTRNRAERYRSEVESLLAAHFGVAVPLQVVTEGDLPAPGAPPTARGPQHAETGGRPDAKSDPERAAGHTAPRESARTRKPGDGATDQATTDQAATDQAATDEAEEEIMAHVGELQDANVKHSGMERLAEAFPGAEIVEPEEAT